MKVPTERRERTSSQSEQPKARKKKILSIRALGNDGAGSTSSVVAAIRYAVEQEASIINLSLYTKSGLASAVLEAEIQNAIEAGITVVGAAGNDGADAAGYVPGKMEAAYILGACDENGMRLENSNYGSTVDFNILAGSTSEAAAKFSGLASLHGAENVADDGVTVFAADAVDAPEESQKPEETSEPEKEGEAEDGQVYAAALGGRITLGQLASSAAHANMFRKTSAAATSGSRWTVLSWVRSKQLYWKTEPIITMCRTRAIP